MLSTPYYLINEVDLLKNLQKINYVREKSEAKILLALKCFSTWSVFPLIKEYMDGTTSSSLYEVKLGYEKFGKETHAYSVAYAQDEIDEIISLSDKVIFNSISQLEQFKDKNIKNNFALRINPLVGCSQYLLANPVRIFSRLGEALIKNIEKAMPFISGLMIHNNCENNNFESFEYNINIIEEKFSDFLYKIDWLSLGGGIAFTDDGYPIDKFCELLKNLKNKYNIQIYLEPGEAVITNSATLEVSVLDTFFNGKNIAIVDSSIESHMLDLLTYGLNAKYDNRGEFKYLICGKSCLAGDIFGEFYFEKKLRVGDRISFKDTAGYTMVKKNWFNGIKMPSIVIKKLNGDEKLVKSFSYNDFLNNLS